MRRIIIITMLLLFGIGITSCVEKELVRYDLVSAQVRSSMYGDFFLASGTIEEESYFIFYIKESGGYITLQKFRTQNCKIKYIDSTITPYVEGYRFKESSMRRNTSIFCNCGDDITLYIPEGTIRNDFNGMNLNNLNKLN